MKVAWAIGARLSTSSATAAPVGGFPLLAVLVYIADEYPTGLTPLRWTHFCHAACSSSSLTSSNSAGLKYPKAECLLRVL